MPRCTARVREEPRRSSRHRRLLANRRRGPRSIVLLAPPVPERQPKVGPYPRHPGDVEPAGHTLGHGVAVLLFLGVLSKDRAQAVVRITLAAAELLIHS